MRDLRRSDGAHELEPVQVCSDPIEEALATAKESWRDAELHFVDKAGVEVLLGGLGAARQRHILVTRSRTRLVERGLDAIGDERERGVSERERLARVMREHEHRVMEWRI